MHLLFQRQFFTKYHNQLVGLFAEYIMGILGNAVGGSLFMAVPLIFMTKPATVKPRVENDSDGGALWQLRYQT